MYSKIVKHSWLSYSPQLDMYYVFLVNSIEVPLL